MGTSHVNDLQEKVNDSVERTFTDHVLEGKRGCDRYT
jgi:hypothetical protein